MANNIIPNVNPGDLVGSTPTFPTNAVVKGDFLYLRDANGNQISGRTVSDGDEITVLDIGYSKQLVLVQYPTGSGYRQGYVSNATSIIKYKDDYSWVNGSTPEAVYDLDKTTQIGTLDPRERAVVLYKVDGMTAVAYDTGKGKLTKSGLVHYEGSGSSNGGGSINGIAPGEVVPGGFTYENNAQVVGDELYLRDANGNRIPGRSVSNGDKITVLDVGYTKQLALVQYPAGDVVRQGYVTNATNLIRYFRQGEWLNGSTTEPVLDENGGSLGSLSPYEAATPLYKKNGMIHVVYDTSKGPNTKSGYVKFEGLAQLPDTSIQIPSVSHSQATVEVYGTSGKGRPLKVYKIGNGSKVLFAGFAIHGWEDRWDNDGLALVNIANSLISKIGDYKAQNGLHGWTVYIAPCMNPDGVIVRGTNNGPGRCAVTTRVDMNRCFPYNFSPQYTSRNYTGPNPLGAPEAVALKNLVERINSSSSEMVVLDFHGWMNFTQGNAELGRYFGNQFGFGHNNGYSSGFFSSWATTLRNTKAVLIEYPTNTYSYNDVINKNYIGKTFNGIINIIKNNPNGGDVDNGGNSGGSSSSDVRYIAAGEVINVQSFLNVRKGPGTNYDSIGQLHQGEKVSIVATNKEWNKIEYGTGYGYVHKDFVNILYRDINEELRGLMVRYEYMYGPQWNGITSGVANLAKFYNLVRNGSIVDLKNQGWDENQYYFNGKIYRKDAPGNILYGYLGKVFGFTDELLLRAAGFAQKEAGTSKPEFGDPFGNPPYGDDPYDQECIKDGIDYFNKYRK
ncbi:polymorphic toxin type 44 domain-containing protein [Clostridium perfringens]|nr:polymorphic toxin type 44 domain-containing protein [Clostridium perfringens]MDK0846617.1 polymorphic toxin type 44 domain-containing protein [Clostridium perfringens]